MILGSWDPLIGVLFTHYWSEADWLVIDSQLEYQPAVLGIYSFTQQA